MRTLPVILLLLSVTLCTCLKPPHYSDIPAISNAFVAFDTVVSGSANDFDTVTFSFTDGNGNLGTNIADTNTSSTLNEALSVDSFFNLECATAPSAFDLFVLDSRSHNGILSMTPYQIPVIPAQGSSKAISGTISFNTPPLTSTAAPGATDSLFFYIMVRDQAGNCSNIIKSPTIYIVP